MRHPELVRQHVILKSLIRRAGHDPSTHDLEMLGHWGRYLCILTAGFIENAVRYTYSRYIEKNSNQQSARYAVGQIESVQNPKAHKLLEIARAFDEDWAHSLETFLDDNFRREAVNTIMANRHLIAHGKNSEITIARVDQYLTQIVEIVEFIEGQCGA